MALMERSYEPKDALGRASSSALTAGAVGLAASAIQNSLAKTNVGALGIFTRSGTQIAMFAAMGGVYEFTKNASANLRRKDDVYNTSIGAFLGGSVIGLSGRSFPKVLQMGVIASVVLSAFEYTGGSFRGSQKTEEVDDFERKQEIRKNKRRPIQETISELGEGRGIYAPGYQERRAQRLKENYGIDVPAQ